MSGMMGGELHAMLQKIGQWRPPHCVECRYHSIIVYSCLSKKAKQYTSRLY